VKGELRHLGITAPNRSMLAYANEHRPWQLDEQIWTALIAILKFFQLRSQVNWSLSNLVTLLRMNLFTLYKKVSCVSRKIFSPFQTYFQNFFGLAID
jgi:hypothetical protein